MTRAMLSPSILRRLAQSVKELGVSIRIEATGPAGDRYSIAIFEQPKSDDDDGGGTLSDWVREHEGESQVR